MAKKQSRRSVSLSRTTYERLRAFCETNDISMSQFVETRIGDFLGRSAPVVTAKSAPVRGAVASAPAEEPKKPQPTREEAAKRAADRIFTF